jgi:manganese transport protein
MEGFLNFRMRPWLRRLITRAVAIIPAAGTILVAGEQSTYRLLILSQVILSLQLPFAVIPLIQFTNDKEKMGSFANRIWVQVLAYLTAAIIVGLNIRLAWMTLEEWIENAGPWRPVMIGVVVPLVLGLVVLLGYVTLYPYVGRRKSPQAQSFPETEALAGGTVLAYQTILVPLDHTDRDRTAVSHAATLARQHGSKVVLLHVEEGVTSQVYGHLASTAEIEQGRAYFDGILLALGQAGVKAELVVRHAAEPRHEIVRVAREIRPDLVVMGAHGHKGIQDLIFGATINGVRHDLDVPLLIVK